MNITKKSFLSLALILSMFFLTFAQNPTQPTAKIDEDTTIVKINTDLVQVDVVVTDKKGNQVTDLKAEDFEVEEDGVNQKITNFSYISTETIKINNKNTSTTPKEKLSSLPPDKISLEQARRTIAIVVDDLGLAFENTTYVREMLKDFIKKEVKEGDLVAVLLTSGGKGILQQFTYDKEQLLAALKQIKFNLTGRTGINSYDPLEPKPDLGSNQPLSNSSSVSSGRTSGAPEIKIESSGQENIESLRRQSLAVGTLGTLKLVIQNLKTLPGRKSIILLSDGFPISSSEVSGKTTNDRVPPVQKALQEVVDQANRAALSIYTVDTKIPLVGGLSALDSVRTDPFASKSTAQDAIISGLEARRNASINSQQNLRTLADSTGGDFSPYIDQTFKKAFSDQNGYYLIGYTPEQNAFQKTSFRKLSIKLKVNDRKLEVHSRKGFYSNPTDEASISGSSRVEQLIQAVLSPFNGGEIALKLTPLYSQDQNGAFFRALVHIDTNKIAFTKEESEDWQKASFDILAITYGQEGKVIDQVNRTHNVKVRGEAYEQILKNGFVYLVDVPTKQPGAYQLRVAVRDSSSKKIGSASQYVEVPDTNTSKLISSGIILSSELQNKNGQANTQTESAQGDKENFQANENYDYLLTSATREFTTGSVLKFAYQVYNLHNQPDRKPPLKYQANLFLDGKQIFTGKEISVPLPEQDSATAITGAFQLGKQLVAGNYVLQLITTQYLPNGRNISTEQSIDFEIKSN